VHPSYFLVLDPIDRNSKNELTISGEVSEWLFYVKFWDDINEKYQTDFAQYEEESLTPEIVEDVLRMLLERKSGLEKSNKEEISFRFGWDQAKNELICHVSSKTIVDELEKICALLERSKMSKLEVYCQL
jgi:hypothetical protein